MKRGGWYGESALEVLAIAEVDQMPNGLVAAVVAAAGGTDAILRDLARSVCDRAGLQRPSLPHRELSPMYRIALPQLSQHRVPEFDREGTPFVDVNHPRQVIAPFDMFLAELAEIRVCRRSLSYNVLRRSLARLAATRGRMQATARWPNG
jgi:hypothetical protein